jgi:CBS domain-containing protein
VQERMRNHQLRRIPVTDTSGHLLGLITLNDLALEAACEDGLRRPPIRLDRVALTLATVGRHRQCEHLEAAE